MAWSWLHSPGAPSDIGPVGTIEGRVVGLIPALKLAGDLGGPAVAGYMKMRQRAKEFNDAEGFNIEGVRGGRPVKTGGPPRWTPTGGSPRPSPRPPGPGGGSPQYPWTVDPSGGVTPP